MQKSQSEPQPKSKQGTTVALMLVIIIFLAGGMIYVFSLNNSLRKASAQVALLEEPAAIIKKIGASLELPAEEDPTIARIDDIYALRQTNPQFYATAENGDVLIVYTTMAIIYRDTTDKIIKVAPVIIHEDDLGLSSKKLPTKAGTSDSQI